MPLYVGTRRSLLRSPAVVAAGGGAEATAFLARTSGLDATHTNAYIALIDGLVADGVWAKLDWLHVYATQDSTTALLNLVSTSFNGTANGSPTFTADRGFLGVDGSTTVFIDTGYNPSTQGTTFLQDDAHMSAWSLTDTISGASGGTLMGSVNLGSALLLQLAARYFGTQATNAQINTGFAAGAVITDGSSIGHYIGSRSASNALALYKDGVSVDTDTEASVAIPNTNIHVLARRTTSNASESGADRVIAMASMGGNLGALSDEYYNRLRTYMTAVGVP